MHAVALETSPAAHPAMRTVFLKGPGSFAYRYAAPSRSVREAVQASVREARRAWIVLTSASGSAAPMPTGLVDDEETYETPFAQAQTGMVGIGMVRALRDATGRRLPLSPYGKQELEALAHAALCIQFDRIGPHAGAERAALTLLDDEPRGGRPSAQRKVNTLYQTSGPHGVQTVAPREPMRSALLAIGILGTLQREPIARLGAEIAIPREAAARADLRRRMADERDGHAERLAAFLDAIGLYDEACALTA